MPGRKSARYRDSGPNAAQKLEALPPVKLLMVALLAFWSPPINGHARNSRNSATAASTTRIRMPQVGHALEHLIRVLAAHRLLCRFALRTHGFSFWFACDCFRFFWFCVSSVRIVSGRSRFLRGCGLKPTVKPPLRSDRPTVMGSSGFDGVDGLDDLLTQGVGHRSGAGCGSGGLRPSSLVT